MIETAGAGLGGKIFDLSGSLEIELSEASPTGTWTCWTWAARGLIYQQVPPAENDECEYSSRSRDPFVERLIIWPRQMLGISHLSKFVLNRNLCLTSFTRPISAMPFGR